MRDGVVGLERHFRGTVPFWHMHPDPLFPAHGFAIKTNKQTETKDP